MMNRFAMRFFSGKFLKFHFFFRSAGVDAVKTFENETGSVMPILGLSLSRTAASVQKLR